MIDPIKNRAKVAAWRKANPDKVAAYLVANAERIRARNKKYDEHRKEEKRAYYAERREIVKEYYAKNRSKIIAKSARWCAANPEKARANKAKWAKENPEATRARSVSRRARKRNASGQHTAKDIFQLRVLQKNKCPVCTSSLDDGYHVDHVMPLSLSGRNDRHNLQLLCPSCNWHKNAKHPTVFMQERGFLL